MLTYAGLWRSLGRTGHPGSHKAAGQTRRFEFDVERVSFAMALQRLCAPGSDLQGSQWIATVECPGFDKLELQHYYCATSFLAELRDELEAELCFRERDLFSLELDLIFIDTTSLSVYTDSETELPKRGYSRDRRPDLPQFVLCVVVNRYGWPVVWDIFPGNIADGRSLEMIVRRLRKRLKITGVVLVGDRGMISADTIKLLTQDKKAPFGYVLGCRMRKQKEVTDDVLSRAGRYQKIKDNLEVKEALVGPRRYVVCRNPVEARKDKAAREAILKQLQRSICEEGPKAVIDNRGYARFLRIAKGSVTINQEVVEADARLDGKFVLTTNTDMPASDVASTYVSLWRVERTFREQKTTLEVRPIYHQRDNTSIGHIVASFLALRLEVDLQWRLDENGICVSWPDLMRDLGRVQSVLVELEGTRYQLRTTMQGASLHALHAAGVRPPASITQLSSNA